MSATAPLLTCRDVAELLGVSSETVLRWVHAGTGPPAIRLPGRALRFRPADVEAWLAARTERKR